MSGGRRALVTGGGTGMGAAVVRALARDGFAVAFTYRSSGEAALALAAEVGAQALPLDLADKAAVAAFAEAEAEREAHALVHCAGQPYDALALVMDQGRAEAAMQVNHHAFAALAKAAVRGMVRRRAGRVIAVGSVTASLANPGNAAYAASKAAMAAHCRALAVETARRGVTVNVVAPGFVATAMMAPYEAHRPRMEAQIPAGRFGRAEEVAAVVAFLASDAAAYVTGATIPVDGGLSAQVGVHR